LETGNQINSLVTTEKPANYQANTGKAENLCSHWKGETSRFVCQGENKFKKKNNRVPRSSQQRYPLWASLVGTRDTVLRLAQ